MRVLKRRAPSAQSNLKKKINVILEALVGVIRCRSVSYDKIQVIKKGAISLTHFSFTISEARDACSRSRNYFCRENEVSESSAHVPLAPRESRKE